MKYIRHLDDQFVVVLWTILRCLIFACVIAYILFLENFFFSHRFFCTYVEFLGGSFELSRDSFSTSTVLDTKMRSRKEVSGKKENSSANNNKESTKTIAITERGTSTTLSMKEEEVK